MAKEKTDAGGRKGASGSANSSDLPTTAAAIDKVIHEPARMMIVSYLSVVESADFLFVQSHTGLTAGNLSSHLSKLETAGYVDIQKSFVGKKQHTKLKLTASGREAFEGYRRKMKELLA